MIHRKRRVCIKHGVFDSKLDAFVRYFDCRDSDDCDCVCDNGCVNVVEANDDYFYVYFRHFPVSSGN